MKDTDTVTVSFKIKNTGSVDGAEIAEVYVADKESTIFRPKKELRGFKKVFLKAGEEKEVSVELSKRAFAFYNVELGDWMVETGEFDILVGSSSRDIKLTASMTVESTVTASIPDYRKTAPNYYNNVANITRDDFAAVYGELPNPEIDKNKKIDLYCCLNDARHTKWGGKLCRLIEKIMSGMGSDANGDGKMLAAMATQIPVRNFISMSMGAFSPKQAEDFSKCSMTTSRALWASIRFSGDSAELSRDFRSFSNPSDAIIKQNKSGAASPSACGSFCCPEKYFTALAFCKEKASLYFALRFH